MTGNRSSVVSDDLLDLMQRIVEQEEQALTNLYDATIARVFALALRVAGNQADAEEVVCDVYGQVWDRAQTYNERRGSVMAWLMMMCRSRALDLLRRNASRSNAHQRHAQDAATQPLAHFDPVEDVQANSRLHAALLNADKYLGSPISAACRTKKFQSPHLFRSARSNHTCAADSTHCASS
jgi:RNA polymerase sigma factor (sigma-70 family)